MSLTLDVEQILTQYVETGSKRGEEKRSSTILNSQLQASGYLAFSRSRDAKCIFVKGDPHGRLVLSYGICQLGH